MVLRTFQQHFRNINAKYSINSVYNRERANEREREKKEATEKNFAHTPNRFYSFSPFIIDGALFRNPPKTTDISNGNTRAKEGKQFETKFALKSFSIQND